MASSHGRPPLHASPTGAVPFGGRRYRRRLWAVGSIVGLAAILSVAGMRCVPAWLEIRGERQALNGVIEALRRAAGAEYVGSCVMQCVTELDRLVGSYPGSPDVFAALARFHGRFGLASDAARCWRRCIELDPLSAPMAHHAIGNRALADGEFIAAAEEFRASLAAKPDVFPVQISLAEALLGCGEPREALVVLDDVVREHGRSLPVLALVGQASLQLHRYDEARAAFEGALVFGPNYPAAHHGLATAAARLGDEATASRHRDSFGALQREKEDRHRRALATADDDRDLAEACARTHVDAARVCFAHADADRGIRLLHGAQDLSDTEPSCRLLLAEVHEQQGSASLALAAFRQAADVGEDDAVHALAVAAGLARLGAIDDAESVHRRLIARGKDEAPVHASLAQMLLSARGDPIKAALAARRAADLAPSAPYWALVAEACARAGRVDDAVSAARRAAELEPDNASWERLVERLTKH